MTLKLKIWILLEICLLSVVGAAVMAPPWADPNLNPCAKEPRGWQLLFWPSDGKCYKIFQVGHPCPEGMELSPATSRTGKELYAECRCPPKHALSTVDGKCYQLFTLGPCLEGYYFGPDNIYKNNVTTSSQQIGACKKIPTCPNANSIFWIKGEKCYQKLTKGPCPKGQLLTVDHNEIPVCACNKRKELEMFRGADDKCYQHFTRGPCKEKGTLFLPDQTCDCHDFLPHHHRETNKCYELGTIGPCNKGEMFTILPKTSTGGCVCRNSNIRYKNNNSCHRPFTQGPCEQGEILLNSTTCIHQPCQRGELYYPSDGKCYRIGSGGPCDKGKIISFDFKTRPSVDGVSYNGVCACGKRNCEGEIECDKSKGLTRYGDKCFKLYSQGPCAKGAWLVPRREGRELLTENELNGAMCECISGNVRRVRMIGNVHLTECLPQTALLAEFLNNNFTQNKLNY
ncbi:unnamed protein product [Ceutorhynchus assimilis]|uniref:DUF4789 domain-containing protein n=1 Tax=Ceutorhynchus assimilis TaxID=467358 RepID=A0A9P0DL88_9CUCU|nr:unnamed protein product [Ceutorhynchus assimilis]